MPRPKRQYDALEFTLSKRYSNNYFWSASYVVSRLYGNYSGIAASEEISTPTTGVASATAQQQAGSIARPGGNANRAWDIDEIFWDSHGTLDVLGRLPTDRPHVVKLYGSYMAPFGTQFGVNFYGGSGTPLTTYVNTVNQTNAFVEGRGDLGRTDMLTRTDFLVSHELKLGDGNKRLRLELNLLNAFNQKTSRHQFNYLNRGAGAPRVVGRRSQRRRRPPQRVRLQRDDRRVGRRRQRLRSALRDGRPLRARHAGLLHGSLHLLSPRGGAFRAAVLGLFDCTTKAGCPRASGLFCVRRGAYSG